MSTQTKSDPITDSIETTTAKVTALGNKTLENSKKASATLLDSHEKTVATLVDSYTKFAQSTNVEWISTVAGVQADVVREATRSYTSAARVLVD